MKSTIVRSACSVVPIVAAFLLLCGFASAQSTDVKGPISSRSGDTMTVKAQGSDAVTVLLTPSTKVEESQGLFRHETMNVSALVPGLFVQVKGSNNDQKQLVADTVKFSGSDLKAAVDSQAGLAPTQQKVQQNQAQIKAQQQIIQQQQAELDAEKKASAEPSA